MKIDLQALVVPFVKAFYGEVICSPERLAGLYGDESVCFSNSELFKGANEIVQGSAWRSSSIITCIPAMCCPLGTMR